MVLSYGIGGSLNKYTLSEDGIYSALEEVMENPKYGYVQGEP